MHSLISGATGFLGQRLAETLVADGQTVRVFVRDPERLPGDLQSRCEVFVGDLGSPSSLAKAVEDITVIYHCAANVKTWDTLEAYKGANVTGVRNLLDAIAAYNPDLQRLVHLSTVDVYGYPAKPCNEDCPLDGDGFGYGETKLAGERLVRQYSDSAGIPFTIVRPANIIGPRSPLISRIGDELRTGIMLKIDGGKANAGLIYLDNLISYLRWAAAAPVAEGQTYNARDDYDVDWSTFLDDLRCRLKGHGMVVNLPYGAADRIARVLESAYSRFLPHREPVLHRLLVRMFGRTCGHSAAKLHRAAEVGPMTGFEEAMKRSAEWYRASRR